MPTEVNPRDQELAVGGPGGLSLRAKGYRIMDLALVAVAIGWTWGAFELRAHAGESERQNAALIKAVTESNKVIVDSLKESNEATVKALQNLATEQRKSTLQITIGNCMNEFSMKNRPDAREICRRIILREDR